MLKRYSREEMRGLWSPEAKFRNWLQVEFAVMQARAERGIIPFPIPVELFEKIIIDSEEINRLEKEVGHDVIAFLMHVSPQLPSELQPWLHRGMTSYDAQDTALSLTLVESVKLLITDVEEVMDALERRAREYKLTPMVGRTHGVHAEPITFGVKLAKWYVEMARHRERLERLVETVAVGKLSGAVGMYTLDPEIEATVCDLLNLKPILATQIIPRDIIAEYAATLALIAGSLGNFCTTLRGLARTEIREVMEFFDIEKQRGSSAMPHKKNPITWEQITGICRDIGSRFMTAFQNQVSWDERDLSNSAPERLLLPEITVYLDYVFVKFAKSITKMTVLPQQMMRNLSLMNGLIYSQEVLSLLASKGLPREEAYGIVREIVMTCWRSGFQLDFLSELEDNERVMELVSETELDACFNLDEKLKHVDHIFEEAFGKA